MAGVETSKITTAGSTDLVIEPGGQTQIKSVQANNPGVTPVAAAADGTVKKLTITDLNTKAQLDDTDWVVIHDSATNTTKRVAGDQLGGVAQPPMKDPLPEDNAYWVDKTSVLAVKAGGLGSTAALQNSVEFAVANNTFDQADKNVQSGQLVRVRWQDSKISAAAHGQTISGTLYAKSGSSFTQTWNYTLDKQPTFDIPPLTGIDPNTEVTSSVVLPIDYNAPSQVTIVPGTLTGVTVSVNGDPFTASPGLIAPGQLLQVKGTTGPDNVTDYTVVIDIGGSQATWTVTTAAAAGPPAMITGEIISPMNNAANIPTSVTIKCNTWVALGGAADANSAQWQLRRGSTTGTNHPGFPTTINSPASLLEVGASSLANGGAYFVRVRHSNGTETGTWSAWSKFTVIAAVPPPPPPPPVTPPPPEWGGVRCKGANEANVDGSLMVPNGGWTRNPVGRDYQECNPGFSGLGKWNHVQANAQWSDNGTFGNSPSSRGCRAWAGSGPSQCTKEPSCGENAGTSRHGTKFAYFSINFNPPNTSGIPNYPSFAAPDRSGVPQVPCSRSFSSTGTITGDTNGTATAGTKLTFSGIEYDGAPVIFTNTISIGITSFKHVADDGSEGQCGGTEETPDYWLPDGFKTFKWPASANEIFSLVPVGRKVTEITFSVRMRNGFGYYDPQTIGTIYAAGCP